MGKHLIEWNKAEKAPITGDTLYRSKCGRFEIAKVYYASGRRGYFNQVGYKMKVIATSKIISADTLDEAKFQADWEIDPNWEES